MDLPLYFIIKTARNHPRLDVIAVISVRDITLTTETRMYDMKPHSILKTWLDMDFVFPHWTLYRLFWLSLLMIPVPMLFAGHSGPISYKTGYALSVYMMFIFALVYMLAAFIGYKYTHIHGGGVKNYEHRRNKVIAVMVPIGAATLYFTGYLFTIPFGHAPNYTFTLKPSPQLEMELNHLLGDDTLEYTPFDYSLDEQEITYVTDGVNVSYIQMISNFIRRPEKYVALNKNDLEYFLAIEKLEPFQSIMLDGQCYLQAKTLSFEPRIINHSQFKTPIIIERSADGSMIVNAKGVLYARGKKCEYSFPYGSKVSDIAKSYAVEAYIQFPKIYNGVFNYSKVLRREYNFSPEHFDSLISSF